MKLFITIRIRSLIAFSIILIFPHQANSLSTLSKEAPLSQKKIFQLSMLAMFRDEGKYLKEWIDYHRLVGIEHFWLYNDHGEDNWREVLQEYINEGIVEVIDWTEGTHTWNFTYQAAIYVEGLKKATGRTKWLAILDLDEFLVPMKNLTITECLDQYYENAAEVYVNYRHFGTGHVTISEGESMLYHLTSCSLKHHPSNLGGKCIVRPEYVILEKVWTPHYFEIYPGGKLLNGNGLEIPLSFSKDLPHSFLDFSKGNNDKLLRVNHYKMRDEFFFWNYRYKRTGDKKLLMENYEEFSLMKDFAIMRFVKKIYPHYFIPKQAENLANEQN